MGLGHVTAQEGPVWRRKADSFVLYLMTLWLLAGLYTEWVEAPVAAAIASLWRARGARLQREGAPGRSE